MKKYIIILLIAFATTPIFAVSKDDIIGTWKDGNVVLNITSDSIFWDEYTDDMLSELIEGDIYSYTINGDTIIYSNEMYDNSMILTTYDNLLIVHIPHECEPYIYKKVKIDLYQENENNGKKVEKKLAYSKKK